MVAKKISNITTEESALTILQELKDGTRTSDELSKEMCLDCTELLVLEGYSKASIGQILGKSQRTIKRYLEEIWEKNSKRPSPKEALLIISEMIQKARSQEEHLMRLARDQEGSLQERVQAAYYAFKIRDGTIARLQTLGYLPSVPQKLIGEIYHYEDEDGKTLPQFKEELESIKVIAERDGILDKEMEGKIKLLQFKIEKEEIEQVLREKNKSEEIKEENTNEQ